MFFNGTFDKLKTCCYVKTGCMQALSNFVSCQFKTSLCFLLLFTSSACCASLMSQLFAIGNCAIIIVL